MEIAIDEQYWLRSDERNFILARKRITQEGENAGQESWENVGHYTSLSGLVKGCLDRQLRGSKANTLAELDRDYQASYTALKRLYGELDSRLKENHGKGDRYE